MKKKSSDTPSKIYFSEIGSEIEWSVRDFLTIGIVDPPRGGREKTYVDYVSDTMSIASMRSMHSDALEALVPFGREHFKDK